LISVEGAEAFGALDRVRSYKQPGGLLTGGGIAASQLEDRRFCDSPVAAFSGRARGDSSVRDWHEEAFVDGLVDRVLKDRPARKSAAVPTVWGGGEADRDGFGERRSHPYPARGAEMVRFVENDQVEESDVRRVDHGLPGGAHRLGVAHHDVVFLEPFPVARRLDATDAFQGPRLREIAGDHPFAAQVLLRADAGRELAPDDDGRGDDQDSAAGEQERSKCDQLALPVPGREAEDRDAVVWSGRPAPHGEDSAALAGPELRQRVVVELHVSAVKLVVPQRVRDPGHRFGRGVSQGRSDDCGMSLPCSASSSSADVSGPTSPTSRSRSSRSPPVSKRPIGSRMQIHESDVVPAS
jgi:hypothetical protein